MITLLEAKKHLRVEHDDEDALILGLIQAAYKHAENKTRRAIAAREESLILDQLPERGAGVELPFNPVQEVLAFDYINTDGNPESLDLLTLRLDKRTLYPVLMPQFGTEWPDVISEPESVTITLRVGYEETPADIRQALLLLISHFYEHREAVVAGVSITALPMGVDMLLGPYQIQRVA